MKKYKFNINGTNYSVDINDVEGQNINLEVNGTPYTVSIDQEIKQVKTPKLVRSVAVPSTETTPVVSSSAKIGSILSPLPGVILDVLVNVGDKVNLGQKVLMLEAMKMENNIMSDKEGTVTEVKVKKGDSVIEGDVLIIIGE